MSIEEVERILDETQEAVEYQRVCVAGRRLTHCQVGTCVASHCFPGEPRAAGEHRAPVGNTPHCPLMFPREPRAHQTCLSIPLLLPQQIDELLAGSFTQEDEDAILEELNAITQVQVPRAVWSPGGRDPRGLWVAVCPTVVAEPRVPVSQFPSYGDFHVLKPSFSQPVLQLRELCAEWLEADPAVCCRHL